MTSKTIGNFILSAAIVFAGIEIWSTKRQVDASQELAQSPVVYSDWIPDKEQYQPGDLIKFSYLRETKPQTEPLLLIMVESFENADTGEIFLGSRSTKRIRQYGKEQLVAARRVPKECTPGHYTVEGLAEAQSSQLSRAVGYSSKTFVIAAKPSPEPTPGDFDLQKSKKEPSLHQP